MDAAIAPEFVEEELLVLIREAISSQESSDVLEAFGKLSDVDARHAFFQLETHEQSAFLEILPAESSELLLDDLPAKEIALQLSRVSPEIAGAILEVFDPSAASHVLDEMSRDDARKAYDHLSDELAQDIDTVSKYKDDCLGAYMDPSPVVFAETASVGQILKQMIGDDEALETVAGAYPCVITESGEFRGFVSLRDLITNPKSKLIIDLIEPAVALLDHAPIADAVQYFEDNEAQGAPVTNSRGRLVGVIYRDDVSELLSAKLVDDAMKVSGVVGDELRSMPLIFRSRRRLAWLSANIVLNVIAASVISAYEETLAAVIALAVFLPMVSDMSGCSGNQAVAVSMRELALGTTRPSDALYVWWKEVSVGLINGICLGIIIGCVAWIWKGNPILGGVIGAALAVNTIIAVSIGGVVPLLLKRFDIDPAVASGPLLTTITDMAGFFLVLGLATLCLPWLV